MPIRKAIAVVLLLIFSGCCTPASTPATAGSSCLQPLASAVVEFAEVAFLLFLAEDWIEGLPPEARSATAPAIGSGPSSKLDIRYQWSGLAYEDGRWIARRPLLLSIRSADANQTTFLRSVLAPTTRPTTEVTPGPSESWMTQAQAERAAYFHFRPDRSPELAFIAWSADRQEFLVYLSPSYLTDALAQWKTRHDQPRATRPASSLPATPATHP